MSKITIGDYEYDVAARCIVCGREFITMPADNVPHLTSRRGSASLCHGKVTSVGEPNVVAVKEGSS